MSATLEGNFETGLVLSEKDSSRTVPIDGCFPRLVDGQYSVFVGRIKRSQELFGWTDAEVVEALNARFREPKGLIGLAQWLSWLSSREGSMGRKEEKAAFRRQRANECVMSFYDSLVDAIECLNVQSPKVAAMVFISRLHPRLGNKSFKEICERVVKIEQSSCGSMRDFQSNLHQYLHQIEARCIFTTIKCHHCIKCNEHLNGGLFHSCLFECLSMLGCAYIHYDDNGREESNSY
jgi:hypothetical protein